MYQKKKLSAISSNLLRIASLFLLFVALLSFGLPGLAEATCATSSAAITTDMFSYVNNETIEGDIVVTNDTGGEMTAATAYGNIYDSGMNLVSTVSLAADIPAGVSAYNLSDLFGALTIDPSVTRGEYTMEVKLVSNDLTCEIIGTTPVIIGNILNVPSVYGSIQGADNIAIDGDLILVDDGTYAPVYIWNSVRIESVNGPAVTKIEGNILSESMVNFSPSLANAKATLVGFSISTGYEPGVDISNYSITIKDCIITNNFGGGISARNSSLLAVKNCMISNNSGSGIYTDSSSSLTVTNCTIANNSSFGTVSYGPSTTVTNTILWGNTSSLGFNQVTTTGGNATLDHCNVQGGYAAGSNIMNQAPLFTFAEGGNLHLLVGSPCIDAGTATGAPEDDVDGDARPIGAGIDIGADEFNASSFTTHTVTSPGTIQAAINASSDGDLILVSAGTYTENLSITKNIVVRAVDGQATTIIDGNNLGSAVTFAAGLLQRGGIDGFTITNGNTTGNGGGVNAPNSSPTIANCNITGNSATGNGGGISVAGSHSQNITNCLITDNTASVSGGGINAVNTTSHFITNCTVSNNTASVSGGGIFADNAWWQHIINTILWGDTAPVQNELNGDAGAWITFNNCFMEGGVYWWGVPSIDPLFVNAAAGDYHLQATSPAINYGTYYAASDLSSSYYIPLKDIDGVTRPQGAGIDIGAYEDY
ncbi:choice-of-anchor Q domain-containing protein [Thermodesulfobacteriota bacterium]